MSENNENNQNNEPNENEAVKQPVSRRDFLRRAGKEAVTTGASLVPGAALAKTVLKSTGGGAGKKADTSDANSEKTGGSDANETPEPFSLWRWITGRRQENRGRDAD